MGKGGAPTRDPLAEIPTPLDAWKVRHLERSGMVRVTGERAAGGSETRPDLSIYLFDQDPWRAYALCADPEIVPDPNIFFAGSSPESEDVEELGWSEATNLALQCCYLCPARWECLHGRLREKFGVWGGFVEKDRKAIARTLERETGVRGGTLEQVQAMAMRLLAAGKLSRRAAKEWSRERREIGQAVNR